VPRWIRLHCDIDREPECRDLDGDALHLYLTLVRIAADRMDPDGWVAPNHSTVKYLAGRAKWSGPPGPDGMPAPSDETCERVRRAFNALAVAGLAKRIGVEIKVLVFDRFINPDLQRARARRERADADASARVPGPEGLRPGPGGG